MEVAIVVIFITIACVMVFRYGYILWWCSTQSPAQYFHHTLKLCDRYFSAVDGDDEVHLDSLNKFRNFNPDAYVVNVMRRDEQRFVKIAGNADAVAEFRRRFSDVLGRVDGHPCLFKQGVKKKLTSEAEAAERSFAASTYTLVWEYTSPNGRNHYEDSRSYNTVMLGMLLQQAEDERLSRDSVKTERDKLNASLRFKILNRDHFTCMYCGKTQLDGATLHVDHIIPVSKGGKTVEENLITACSDCNLGKSNKIVPQNKFGAPLQYRDFVNGTLY